MHRLQQIAFFFLFFSFFGFIFFFFYVLSMDGALVVPFVVGSGCLSSMPSSYLVACLGSVVYRRKQNSQYSIGNGDICLLPILFEQIQTKQTHMNTNKSTKQTNKQKKIDCCTTVRGDENEASWKESTRKGGQC